MHCECVKWAVDNAENGLKEYPMTPVDGINADRH